jgi:beta-lactamase superfamily II metal-dependent hydrolase
LYGTAYQFSDKEYSCPPGRNFWQPPMCYIVAKHDFLLQGDLNNKHEKQIVTQKGWPNNAIALIH